MQEKIISSGFIYEGKVLNLKVDKVQLPNGKLTSREIVVHPGAVAVVPVTVSKEIILIKQYRHAVNEIIWEIPAGKLEKGEDTLICAQRELAEETGFGASEWVHLSTFFTTPGFSDEIMYLYMATDLYTRKLEADEDEFIEIYKVPFHQAEEMVKSGEIKDVKTICGILLAAKKM